MTPEWEARWDVLCDRLIAEAERRGGSGGHGARGRHWLGLDPPRPGHGTRMEVQLLEAETALLRTGWTITDMPLHWTLGDGLDNQLESVVVAVMDGGAEEVALVNDTGEWLDVRAVIHHAGGSSARGSLLDPPDPALHQYVHRLPAWSAASSV